MNYDNNHDDYSYIFEYDVENDYPPYVQNKPCTFPLNSANLVLNFTTLGGRPPP